MFNTLDPSLIVVTKPISNPASLIQILGS